MPKRNPNNYVVEGDRVFINISTPSHPNTSTIIDIADLQRVINLPRRWMAHDNGWGVYAVASNQKTKLHRFVMDAPKYKLVDHKNGDRLDNRKSNLHFVSHAENNRNQKRRKNNQSGAMGVYLEKDSELWAAQIHIGNTKIFLGRYEKRSEANIARFAAEKVLDFSPLHGREINE